MDSLLCLYDSKDKDKMSMLKRTCAQKVITLKEYKMCMEFFKDGGICDELN